MAHSDIRRKLLTYLHQLPDDQSVQPGDLPGAIGLPANQVIPSLTAAKKRGEVETLTDGSVRVSSAARHGFRDGKLPFRSLLPDAFGVPLHILNKAISQVPAVKYALGLAGVAGAGAIIYLLLANLQNAAVWLIAGLVVLVVLLFMVLLFIFARLIEIGGPVVHLAGIVLMWFVLLLFMAVCTLLTTSIFIRWPRDLTSLRTPSAGEPIVAYEVPEKSRRDFEFWARELVVREGFEIKFTKCKDQLKKAKVRPGPRNGQPLTQALENLSLSLEGDNVQQYRVQFHQQGSIYEIIGE